MVEDGGSEKVEGGHGSKSDNEIYRTDSLEINGRTRHWTGGEDVCGVCNLGVRESLEHVVMECSLYEKERISLRESIESRAGVRVEEMDREEQMRFILGFQQVQEGKRKVLEAVRSFLERIWRVRCRAVENETYGGAVN